MLLTLFMYRRINVGSRGRMVAATYHTGTSLISFREITQSWITAHTAHMQSAGQTATPRKGAQQGWVAS